MIADESQEPWESDLTGHAATSPAPKAIRAAAEAGFFPPVIHARLFDDDDVSLVETLIAQVANCGALVDGQPCGNCAPCVDAASKNGLAVIRINEPVRSLDRLRLHLLHQQSVKQTVVSVKEKVIKAKKARDVMEAMPGKVAPNVTFLFISTE